ncbi:AAA family ATPase [Paraburkholderia tropica]|uniref:AAA family ATPase n=1 Tax=Paraburkholderia tropica TaxID=92647 RepID=UPI002AAF2E4B|nr:AAA family ATPase [Paraburkholderia tropica]
MIDLLITSTDDARLSSLVRLVGECGAYRTTRAAVRPGQLAGRADTLDAFDVLIVDARTLHDADLAAVADLTRRHERLTCILLIPEASPEALLAAMRAGFRDVLTGEPERRAIGDALQRAGEQRSAAGAHATRVISFVSCKGGVGASFIAANVAHLIASAHQQRALLIDLNQLYGDAAFLVTGETPPSTLEQLSAQVDRMDVAFFEASVTHAGPRFDILAGAGDPVKAAEIRAERLEWILGVAMPRYDFVILDLGPSINPVSMLALDRSSEIHVVLQASMPHLRAGRRLLDILHALGYAQDSLHLVLNRLTRYDDAAREAAPDVLGIKPQLTIADDARAVSEAINHGVPIAEAARSSTVTRSLQTLAADIVMPQRANGGARVKRESMLARFVGRQGTPKLGTL